MAAAHLTLYDVIVDLVPGVVAVGLAWWLVGSGWTGIGAVGGVSLLFVAYAIGRLFHALGSTRPVEWFRNSLESVLLRRFLADRKHGLSLEHRLHSVLGAQSDPHGDGVEQPSPPREFSDAERRVHRKAVRKLEREFEVTTPIRSGDVSIPDDLPVPKDARYLRYLGENYLYGRDTLYRKYEMLTTFYRSLWLIFTVGALSYVGYIVAASFGPLEIATPLRYAAVAFVTVLAALVALRQRVKYEYKKHRAFVHDLHIELDVEG